ncbi:MAG: putative toxin-antitoxin system toxin component, PIN family [Phycisphaerae bacterium]
MLDTNVLLSAVFFPGVCESLLARCLISPSITIVLSEHILQEFTRHGTGKLNGSPERVDAAVHEFRKCCEIVTPASVSPEAFQDPDDLPVLGTAVTGRADLLVTGDRQLLALDRFESIPIVSPKDLQDQLAQG